MQSGDDDGRCSCPLISWRVESIKETLAASEYYYIGGLCKVSIAIGTAFGRVLFGENLAQRSNVVFVISRLS
jgi:hypothetical protein